MPDKISEWQEAELPEFPWAWMMWKKVVIQKGTWDTTATLCNTHIISQNWESLFCWASQAQPQMADVAKRDGGLMKIILLCTKKITFCMQKYFLSFGLIDLLHKHEGVQGKMLMERAGFAGNHSFLLTGSLKPSTTPSTTHRAHPALNMSILTVEKGLHMVITQKWGCRDYGVWGIEGSLDEGRDGGLIEFEVGGEAVEVEDKWFEV